MAPHVRKSYGKAFPDIQQRLRLHHDLTAQAREWAERSVEHQEAGEGRKAASARNKAAAYLAQAMALEGKPTRECVVHSKRRHR